MKIIYWDDSFNVGVTRFNDHHKHMLNLRNELVKLVQFNAPPKKLHTQLEALLNYTSKHFRAEESLMEEYNYPKLKEHQEEHNFIIQEVLTYMEHLYLKDFKKKELDRFVNRWVFEHIQSMDKKYMAFFKECLDKEELGKHSQVFETVEVAYMVWNESYDVGIEKFNEDHKALFTLQNQLVNMVQANIPIHRLQLVVDRLIEFVKNHFEREEKEMERAGYSRLVHHRKEHENFIIDLEETYEDLKTKYFKSEMFLQMINAWLYEHIRYEDVKYKDILCHPNCKKPRQEMAINSHV